MCPQESVKAEARQAIGERYLAWKAKIDFSFLYGTVAPASPGKK